MNLLLHNPEMLWLLVLLPLLAYLMGRPGRRAAVVFPSVAVAAAVSRKARQGAGRWLFILRLLALVALIIALARPQLGKGHTDIESSGIDIMLALDLSGSMRALDMSTEREYLTRIDAMRDTVLEFIEKRPNDRIGLVVFARESFLISPLTLNHDWLLQQVERMRLGMIDPSATAIGPAIAMSANRLRDLPAESRVIVLLTDGEDNVRSVPPIAAAEAAAAFGIRIYTIAAGRPGRVPFPRIGADGELLRDARGRPILEGYMEDPIDEETLREIARVSGGKYFRAHDKRELQQIYREIDSLETSEVKLRKFATYEELFMWPALLGILLFGLEQLLGNTRYRRLP